MTASSEFFEDLSKCPQPYADGFVRKQKTSVDGQKPWFELQYLFWVWV